MAKRLLTHTFHVDAPSEKVFEHLTTPESYVGLSPIVVAVRDVDRSEPGVIRYTAIERFRFLAGWWWKSGITHDNAIEVALHTDGLSVYGEVRSPGGIRMAYRFSLTPDGTGTRVDDRLDMTAPWFLIGYASGEARKVQLARARILAQRLSTSPA
ncbi:SRPBCC family protein [Planotetraspora sp. GP83]|uniref:SRPBCC family protein n=1 Tax=Planotetraspora sp. GP83 TaxID=3156264 RepID=UPI0035118570